MSSEYHQKYRAANRQRLAAQTQRRREEWRLHLLELVGQSKCLDCGNTDTRVLQFDHVRGDKIANVSAFLDKSWVKALAEASKCEVVCANCHVIRTRQRQPIFSLEGSVWQRLSKTHFPCGHEKSKENVYRHKNKTSCLNCRRSRGRVYMRLKRAKAKEQHI